MQSQNVLAATLALDELHIQAVFPGGIWLTFGITAESTNQREAFQARGGSIPTVSIWEEAAPRNSTDASPAVLIVPNRRAGNDVNSLKGYNDKWAVIGF